MITIHGKQFEQSVWEALQDRLAIYIGTRPLHDNGLCWWLRGGAAELPEYRIYAVVGAMRSAMGGDWASGEYVDDVPGPTEKRLAFVRAAAVFLDKLLKPQLLPSLHTPPPAGTQAARVLAALEGGQNRLDIIAAFAQARETAASARIRELRSKYGYNIETRRAPGKAQRFTYHLTGV